MNDGTLKVTPITAAASQQAHATFTITAQVEGFPIQIEIIDANADKLLAMINRLKAIGAEPPVKTSANIGGQQNTPTCPEHGTAKPSKKPGSFYCPKALPDGGYCKWTGRA